MFLQEIDRILEEQINSIIMMEKNIEKIKDQLKIVKELIKQKGNNETVKTTRSI